MTTDIDRLEKVRSGQLTGRGVGKTYAYCYTALEWLRDNPEGVVFWFLPKMGWADHIHRIFDSLIEEFGFQDVRKTRYEFIIGGGRIKFMPVSTQNPHETEYDIREATRGYRKVYTVYESLYEYSIGAY